MTISKPLGEFLFSFTVLLTAAFCDSITTKGPPRSPPPVDRPVAVREGPVEDPAGNSAVGPPGHGVPPGRGCGPPPLVLGCGPQPRFWVDHGHGAQP